MKLLEAAGLTKSFSRRKVVDSVDLHVLSGEIVGLLGPNGAGKTTMFRMIVGMIKPDSGKVSFNGRDASAMAMCRRARLGMGYLSQESSVFQKLTVEQNIMAILETLDMRHSLRRKKVLELMKELELDHLAKAKAYTLSGGERRRLEITRALAVEPKLLLLDEPFAGVDPITVDEIQVILRQLKQRGISILITDHNVRETLSITDRSYIINAGKILVSGSSEVIVNDPGARRLYLGEGYDGGQSRTEVRRSQTEISPDSTRTTDEQLVEQFSDVLDQGVDSDDLFDLDVPSDQRKK